MWQLEPDTAALVAYRHLETLKDIRVNDLSLDVEASILSLPSLQIIHLAHMQTPIFPFAYWSNGYRPALVVDLLATNRDTLRHLKLGIGAALDADETIDEDPFLWQKEVCDALSVIGCNTAPLNAEEPKDALLKLESLHLTTLDFKNIRLSQIRSIIDLKCLRALSLELCRDPFKGFRPEIQSSFFGWTSNLKELSFKTELWSPHDNKGLAALLMSFTGLYHLSILIEEVCDANPGGLFPASNFTINHGETLTSLIWEHRRTPYLEKPKHYWDNPRSWDTSQLGEICGGCPHLRELGTVLPINYREDKFGVSNPVYTWEIEL